MRARFHQVRAPAGRFQSILFLFLSLWLIRPPLPTTTTSYTRNLSFLAVPGCSIHPLGPHWLMYIRRRFPFANSAGLGVRRTLTKKGEKGAAAQGPTHRGHGFFSATRGLSKLSCDTARRRGAPALSSLVAHNLGFLEAPSSSLPLQLLIWVFSLSLFFFFLKTRRERKKTKQQVDLRLGVRSALNCCAVTCVSHASVSLLLSGSALAHQL